MRNGSKPIHRTNHVSRVRRDHFFKADGLAAAPFARYHSMATSSKIILHSLHGYRSELDAIVAQWIQERVSYVGVVGIDASRIEDIIDELCIGDGSKPYAMLTASHGSDETLQDAILLAEQLSGELTGDVRVVEF